MPGNNVELHAETSVLVVFFIMVEPQAALEGAYGQTNTSYGARSATGKK